MRKFNETATIVLGARTVKLNIIAPVAGSQTLVSYTVRTVGQAEIIPGDVRVPSGSNAEVLAAAVAAVRVELAG